MKFVITYTTDYEWNTVDSFMLETDVSPFDMEEKDVADMMNQYIGNEEEAKRIASNPEKWYCLNLDYKPDVVFKKKEDK